MVEEFETVHLSQQPGRQGSNGQTGGFVPATLATGNTRRHRSCWISSKPQATWNVRQDEKTTCPRVSPATGSTVGRGIARCYLYELHVQDVRVGIPLYSTLLRSSPGLDYNVCTDVTIAKVQTIRWWLSSIYYTQDHRVCAGYVMKLSSVQPRVTARQRNRWVRSDVESL